MDRDDNVSFQDYDALTLSPLAVSPPSFHTTVFPVSDSTILPTSEKLIANLRARHYYTDTSTFSVRCGVCGVGLKGETGAREHAMQTGRKRFHPINAMIYVYIQILSSASISTD